MQNAEYKGRAVFFIKTILLFGTWVVFSGKFDAMHLLMGVASSLAVAIFSGNLLFCDTKKNLPSRFQEAIRAPFYLLWLVWQILLANFHVLGLVLHPRMMDKINPRFVTFRAKKLNCEFARYVLANSITLTPGTVTVDVDGDVFLVHALSDTTAEGVPDPMQDYVAKTFNRRGRR